MLDSSNPEVIQAGLERAPGRCVVYSVHLEGGDAPGSTYRRTMELVAEHGAAVVALVIDEQGMARTAERKLEVAERLLADLTGRWGMRPSSVFIDLLTYPIATGQAETRRDALETITAMRELKARHPDVGTILGVSNVSFGLKPAARAVLNSVFLHECRQAGLDAAIVDVAKIMPVEAIPEARLAAALDLVWDRREDALERYLALFEGDEAVGAAAARQAELRALPLVERLARRVVDAENSGLTADLDLALESMPALDIINGPLLAGMAEVGELFGSGRMQLPFVLASAETMKRAVAHLKPHLQRSELSSGKGKLVLATVRGDVHDIGKNLVDIIVTNNGYEVINLGIKQPISAILEAAESAGADAIGMSGLLIKSTLVMSDNLDEIAARGLADKYPVILGGAALTRSYVEQTLAPRYPGSVFYAKDAFAGLALMDQIMAAKDAEAPHSLALPSVPTSADELSQGAAGLVVGTPAELSGASRLHPAPTSVPALDAGRVRSSVARGIPVPVPPFWGTRVVTGIALDEVVPYLDEKALFGGRWGLRGHGAEARERLRGHLDTIRRERLDEFSVVYGYFPAHSEGTELVVGENVRFAFPRQKRDPWLAIPDYFRDAAEAAALGPDVVALQLVTMGRRASGATAELFVKDAYRDYFELHGVTVQLAEALAEAWHARIREELGISGGQRFSFGYPACPDLAQRRALFDLLGAERIGVSLSETFQLDPEQSTDALIVHHPEAHYFSAA
jgi:5-methyltetrahydrofolate--homocysteine methyltransferase